MLDRETKRGPSGNKSGERNGSMLGPSVSIRTHTAAKNPHEKVKRSNALTDPENKE